MRTLHTTLGPISPDQLGLILPHEHIFVDLGPIEAESYKYADRADVIRLMAPQLRAAQSAGVTALVECTPVGVGRRVDLVLDVSRTVSMPIVVATGIYREPWVPAWAHAASQEELAAWMVQELVDGVEETGVRAAWIKLSAGDDGMTPAEGKILRAAAQAGQQTGAVIGSHTIRGRVVHDQLDAIEEAGYRADRFIWIHTQAEPDADLHLAAAQRGAWLEYDAIGAPGFDDDFFVRSILRVLEAGYGHRLLLSQDRGWFDPSIPGGGVPQPYTYLAETFLPRLRRAGLAEDTIRMLTHSNPYEAFAR